MTRKGTTCAPSTCSVSRRRDPMMSRNAFMAVALAALAGLPLLAADDKVVEYVLTVEGMT